MTASMGGSVYFAGIVVVGLIVCAVLVSPFFIIPAAVMVLVALFASPILAAIARGGDTGARPSGTPTTAEASYDPVSQPEDRPT